jgi:hypothetical protein
MRPAGILVDERSRPTLRKRLGQLLAEADTAAFAVARIRLGVLDLSDAELGGLSRCRVLLRQLDATMLLDTAQDPGPSGTDGRGNGAIGRLFRFVTSGRLEVRSAGLGSWTPDFGVVEHGTGRTGLLGAIQFGNPELVVGPALTIVSIDPAITTCLLSRFDQLWDRSHDVLPAIREVLERGHRLGDPTSS